MQPRSPPTTFKPDNSGMRSIRLKINTVKMMIMIINKRNKLPPDIKIYGQYGETVNWAPG